MLPLQALIKLAVQMFEKPEASGSTPAEVCMNTQVSGVGRH